MRRGDRMRWLRRRARPVVEPPAVDLTPPDTLGRFREAAAWWAAGGETGARDTVLTACDLLAEGQDAPALRDLAGLRVDAGWFDSREILLATCRQLGVAFLDRDTDEARLLALRTLCRAFLRKELAERPFVTLSASLFDHGAPDVAADLACIEHLYEYRSFGQRPSTLGERADRCAREYLAATAGR